MEDMLEPKNVVIVDDSPLIRTIFAKMIAAEKSFQVSATFDNAEDCISYVKNNNVHLVLMDMRLPVMNGLEAARILRNIDKEIKILLLFSNNPDYEVLSALYSDVNAYMFKNISSNKLHEIIELVFKNERWIDSRIQHSIFNCAKSLSENDYLCFKNMLTTKEFNLINMVLKGFKKKEVAGLLNLSLSELSLYVYSIFEKLAKIKSIEVAVRNLKYDLC